MFIPDPNFFPSRIQGKKDSRIPEEIKYLIRNIVSKLSEILSGMFISDLDLDFYPSRIPDPGVKNAPNPDPQH